MTTTIKTVKTAPLAWYRYYKVETKTEDGTILEDVNASVETMSPQEFEFQFNNTEDIINFKLVHKDTGKICQNLSIDYNSIKNHVSYADQTFWAVTNSVILKMEKGDGTVATNIGQESLVDILARTFINKGSVHTGGGGSLASTEGISHEEAGKQFPLDISLNFVKVFVPYKGCPVSELEFLIQIPDNNKISVDFNSADGVDVAAITDWKLMISPITVTAPQTVLAGQVTDITITTSNPKITEVYIEPVSGAINKTRIRMTNGSGAAKIVATELDTGDDIRMKFGYKYFTGVTDLVRTLS